MALEEEFFENHIDHEEKVLMYVLTHVLKFHLKLLKKAWHENSDQGSRENEGNLELTNEEHHSYLIDICLLQYCLVVHDVLSILVLSSGRSIFVGLKILLGLCGILVQHALLFDENLENFLPLLHQRLIFAPHLIQFGVDDFCVFLVAHGFRLFCLSSSWLSKAAVDLADMRNVVQQRLSCVHDISVVIWVYLHLDLGCILCWLR